MTRTRESWTLKTSTSKSRNVIFHRLGTRKKHWEAVTLAGRAFYWLLVDAAHQNKSTCKVLGISLLTPQPPKPNYPQRLLQHTPQLAELPSETLKLSSDPESLKGLSTVYPVDQALPLVVTKQLRENLPKFPKKPLSGSDLCPSPPFKRISNPNLQYSHVSPSQVLFSDQFLWIGDLKCLWACRPMAPDSK